MRTELTESEIRELRTAGIRNTRTLYDIIEVLPEQIFNRYYLNIIRKEDDSWMVAYRSTTGEYFACVRMVHLMGALQKILVILSARTDALSKKLSRRNRPEE